MSRDAAPAAKQEKRHPFRICRNSPSISYKNRRCGCRHMGGKQNTKTIKKSVACTPEDIEDFLYLAGKGVKLNAKMAPTDSDVDFEALLKEA